MITGDCDYKQFKMSQHKNAVQTFENFILNIKPSTIIEIGTYTGGFIAAISDIVSKNDLRTKIVSYDIMERGPYSDIRQLGADIRIENIFNDTYSELNDSSKDDIISMIQSQGTTLVLCDGGNKINEFNILAKHLKTGDFIMAHDYSESHDYYNQHIKNKIWNWCEITEKDIANACENNNLVDHMREEFQSVVWVCKRKA